MAGHTLALNERLSWLPFDVSAVEGTLVHLPSHQMTITCKVEFNRRG
jgi:hypothetical protein